jgi:hypothetical protein
MQILTPLGFTLDLADGWFDVTDDLPDGSPYTLGRETGPGAFQFSSALYRSGIIPDAKEETLRSLLLSFGVTHGLGQPIDVRCDSHNGIITLVGNFDHAGLLRVWYVTDGSSFILASYTANDKDFSELSDCEDMIRTIEFTET